MMTSRLPRYAVVALVLGSVPFLAPNEFYVRLAQDIVVMTILVTGVNWLLGLSGQLSLGQLGFYALGAYTSAILSSRYGVPIPVAMVGGVLVAGAAGVLIGLVALRARTHYLAMATLAFAFIVEILAQRLVSVTGGAMGVSGIPAIDFGGPERAAASFFWVAAACYLIIQVASDHVFASRWGRVLLAIKESESFAATVGINVPLWKIGVFIASAMAAGLAGVLFAHQSGYISSDAFGLQQSVMLLVAAVIGGLGRPYGPLLGASAVVLLGQLTATLYEVSTLIFGAVLLVVTLFLPGGLASGFVRRKQAAPATGRMQEGTSPGATAVPRGRDAATGAIPLEISKVSISYSGVRAVEDVSIRIRPGEIHAVIGPNGAGKSSLINAVAGLSFAQSGQVLLAGQDVSMSPAWVRAQAGLARTFQNLQLIQTLPIWENVALGDSSPPGLVAGFRSWMGRGELQRQERARAIACLARVGLSAEADALPGSLAYGHRKLVEIARVLAQQPSVVLLDEPIAGINDEESREIKALLIALRDLGTAIVIVEHNMGFVMSVSDSVTVLDHGRKIADGSPQDVSVSPRVIEAYLGGAKAAA